MRDRAARLPLTGTGAGVATAALALLGLGLVLPSPALAAVGASGLLVLLATGLGICRAPDVQVRRRVGRAAVACGDPVEAAVEVTNRSRVLPVDGRARDLATQLGRVLPVDVQLPVVRPGRTAHVGYVVPTARRGSITLGPLRVHRGDALGLWSRTVHAGGVEQVLVRPRVHPLETVPTGGRRTPDGSSGAVASDGSSAFHSLREYVAGDDRRTIHWPSTARRGELMVRRFVDVVAPRLTLAVDTRALAYQDPDDGLDAVLEVAASVLSACAAAGVETELCTSGGVLLSVASPSEVGGALDALASVVPDAGLGLLEVDGRIRVAPGAALLVLTGTQGLGVQPRDDAALAALAARHDRCLALAVGSCPAARPAGGSAVQHCSGVPQALAAWRDWSGR